MKFSSYIAILLMGTCGLSGCAKDPGPVGDRGRTVDANQRAVWSRYASDYQSTESKITESQAVEMMIVHHQDAIDGSIAYLNANPDGDPSVRSFADRVVRVQTEQIDSMQSFDLPPSGSPPMWMAMYAAPSSYSSDSAYLETMIWHHEEAILMYSDWAANGSIQRTDIGLLMRRIAKGQEGELAFMCNELGMTVTNAPEWCIEG